MASALTDQIDAVLHGSKDQRNPNLKPLLLRLAAEVRHRFDGGSPESYEFLLAAHKCIVRIKGSTHADLRMACLFDCGAYFLANQFYPEGLDCAKGVEALARLSDDKHWIRKGEMLLGVLYAHVGDCGESLRHFSGALALVRDLGHAEGEASVLINLGSTLNYAGLHQEAIPCFKKALSLVEANFELPRDYVASAYCNLAQSFLGLGENQKGLDAISRSLEVSENPSDAFAAMNRVVRETTFVQLALELGKLSSARVHSQKSREYSRQSGARRAHFNAELAAGLCEIHGGDLERGLEILEGALQICERTSVEYVMALNALVRGYDYALRPELALERLSTLIQTIRQRRESSIKVLLSIGSGVTRSSYVDDDLRDLTLRHANLRAKVAERESLNSRLEMMERLAVTADLREEASGAHGYRVGSLSFHLAHALGWKRDDGHALELAARLHDIGKIAVPDRILLSSKQLQEAERHFVATHTTIGAEILGRGDVGQLRMAEEIARHHHEWWNGEGYPSKLKGKRIPIHARIVALADVFDALTHGRPFSPPWPMDKAVAEISARKGTQFDPELTDVFLSLIERLRNEHQDLDEYLGRAGRNSPFLVARNKIRRCSPRSANRRKGPLSRAPRHTTRAIHV